MKPRTLKICGLKSLAEAKELKDLPIDYVGLNFIPSSTRYLSLETALAIMEELRPRPIKTVALFAAWPLEEVNDYVRRLGVDYVQLHGDEPADYARQVEAPVMRAIAVSPELSATELAGFINDYPADFFVLDRQRQGQGQLVSPALVGAVVNLTDKPIFLAGGLTPRNLAETLQQVRIYGIDIAGGVRTSDRLDFAKVINCLKLVKPGLLLNQSVPVGSKAINTFIGKIMAYAISAPIPVEAEVLVGNSLKTFSPVSEIFAW